MTPNTRTLYTRSNAFDRTQVSVRSRKPLVPRNLERKILIYMLSIKEAGSPLFILSALNSDRAVSPHCIGNLKQIETIAIITATECSAISRLLHE